MSATRPPVPPSVLKLSDPALLRSAALLAGSWSPADSGETFPVTNPASGQKLGDVPKMSVAETRRAIEAAQAALPGWRALAGKARSQILRRWNDLILANLDDLAAL